LEREQKLNNGRRVIYGAYLIISFELLDWRKFVLNKYYCKIGDVDIGDPLKHLMWGAML